MCPNSIRKVVDHVTNWTSHVKDFSYLDWSGVRVRNFLGAAATWRIFGDITRLLLDELAVFVVCVLHCVHN